MLSRIISCGQTAVGLAAHDVSEDMDIPYSEGISNDRKCQKDSLDPKRQIRGMLARSSDAAREQNVIDSDGTLIITRGELAGAAVIARDLSEKHKRPWLHVDLEKSSIFQSVSEVVRWAYRQNIDVLNIAGPEASASAELYRDTVKLLKAIFYVDLFDLCVLRPNLTSTQKPGTVEEAVEKLISEIPLKNRVCLARQEEIELSELNDHLGKYIRDHYDLRARGSHLMESCCSFANAQHVDAESASAIIIKELWKKLRMTHTLRVVA